MDAKPLHGVLSYAIVIVIDANGYRALFFACEFVLFISDADGRVEPFSENGLVSLTYDSDDCVVPSHRHDEESACIALSIARRTAGGSWIKREVTAVRERPALKCTSLPALPAERVCR